MNSIDYILHELNIRSSIVLPGLPIHDSEHDTIDISISTGKVPRLLNKPTFINQNCQIGKGYCLLTIPKVARYFIYEGQKILVEYTNGAEDQEVRFFLLGSAFDVLCDQRGLFPVHATP